MRRRCPRALAERSGRLEKRRRDQGCCALCRCVLARPGSERHGDRGAIRRALACDTSTTPPIRRWSSFIGGPLAPDGVDARRGGDRRELIVDAGRRRSGHEAAHSLDISGATGRTTAGAVAPTRDLIVDACARDAEDVLRAGAGRRCTSPRRNCRRPFLATSRARSSPGGRPRRGYRGTGGHARLISCSGLSQQDCQTDDDVFR